MADSLRNLAERHPDLLMRACQCGGLEPHDDTTQHQGDAICRCQGTGRLPLALEEALDALVEKEVGRVPRTTRRLAMYRVLHRLSEAIYDNPDRDARRQPRDAAFRLLIEVAGRG